MMECSKQHLMIAKMAVMFGLVLSLCLLSFSKVYGVPLDMKGDCDTPRDASLCIGGLFNQSSSGWSSAEGKLK